MLQRMEILNSLPKAAQVLGNREELVVAFVFGSVLQDGRQQVRDVDIAVLGRSSLSLSCMGDLFLELVRVFGTNRVDVVDLRQARRELRHEVLSRGRLLAERDGETFTRFRERTLREHLAHRHTTREYYRLLRREFYRSYAHAGR